MEKEIGLHKVWKHETDAGDLQWVSGDYQGATDRLNLNFTKLIFEEFISTRCQHLDPQLHQVFRSVLYEQNLHYPKNSGVPQTQQTNGQLMGSILSFPVLCLANLICYWSALEEFLGYEVHVTKLPVLVNGDDILFRANSEFYTLWQEKVARAGFLLSLGKNYRCRDFLTVNSIGYRVKLTERTTGWFLDHSLGQELEFEHVPYLNVGLLIGQTKLGTQIQEGDKPIWDIYDTVTSSANPQRSHRRFLHYYKDVVKTMTAQGINLFLPRWLGGMGFTPVSGLDFRYTRFQMAYASFVYSKMFSDETGTIPSPDELSFCQSTFRRKPTPVGLSSKKENVFPVFSKGLWCVDVRPTLFAGGSSGTLPFSDPVKYVDDDENQDHDLELVCNPLEYKMLNRGWLKEFRVAKGYRTLSVHEIPLLSRFRIQDLSKEIPVPIRKTNLIGLSHGAIASLRDKSHPDDPVVPHPERPEIKSLRMREFVTNAKLGKCYDLYSYLHFPGYRRPVRRSGPLGALQSGGNPTHESNDTYDHENHADSQGCEGAFQENEGDNLGHQDLIDERQASFSSYPAGISPVG